MHSFYPQAGIRFNPTFTELQFALFAQDVEYQSGQIYQIAFAAFARAADSSQGSALIRLNFEFLNQACQNLLALYRIAREDSRISDGKVGCHVKLLFWAIIGAAEQLLRFEDEGDDWEKDWHLALYRGGLLARLAGDLALSGAAKGLERDQMIGCLSRLGAATAKARHYHLELAQEVPGDVHELVGLADDAGRLSVTLQNEVATLRARGALEAATV